jgi:ElaB/YqjD/DUF883 family membrane-anchored ribosome-binding protein
MESRSAGQIEGSTEKLLRDLAAVIHDGEALLRAGAEGLSQGGVAAQERLMAALEVAKDIQHKLQDQAAAGVKATNRAIREHPYQSVGVAFGIGLLIGVIVNRR